MVNLHRLRENPPFPNSPLPVLFYPKVLDEFVEGEDAEEATKNLLKENGYTNAWTGGIHDFHHFHSNTHEVLVCLRGKATVQLGGPGEKEFSFSKGDVLLLPAGVAHKSIDSTDDFEIVGAYPNGIDFDMQKGDEDNYETIQQRANDVPVPEKDPLTGSDGAVQAYWDLTKGSEFD